MTNKDLRQSYVNHDRVFYGHKSSMSGHITGIFYNMFNQPVAVTFIQDGSEKHLLTSNDLNNLYTKEQFEGLLDADGFGVEEGLETPKEDK